MNPKGRRNDRRPGNPAPAAVFAGRPEGLAAASPPSLLFFLYDIEIIIFFLPGRGGRVLAPRASDCRLSRPPRSPPVLPRPARGAPPSRRFAAPLSRTAETPFAALLDGNATNDVAASNAPPDNPESARSSPGSSSRST